MTTTVVIGAGPYGLSAAAHLKDRGTRPRVFGDPMSAWRDHMPKGMFLKSAPGASNLSAPSSGSRLSDYLRAMGRPPLGADEPVPIEVFVDYGTWFASRHVPELEHAIVTELRRCGADFEVALSSGETVRASTVLVASGHVAYAYVPPELVRLTDGALSADGLVSHSSQHRDFAAFKGRRVAVVGAGQSALESAALLHEAGAEVVVLVRGSEVEWNLPPNSAEDAPARKLFTPRSGLGRGWRLFFFGHGPAIVRRFPDAKRLQLLETVLGPSGAWWLRERVDGKVGINVGCSIDASSTVDGALRLALTSKGSPVDTLDVDHVLAATGYRVRLDSLPFLDPALAASLKRVGGAPQLDASFESSVQGLYFTGLASAPTFGPALRFVYGARFASRRVSGAIARNDRRVRAA